MTTVLIVDDVRAMAEQYAYDLKRIAGFETLVALGGVEALSVLTREQVECVILDLEMPGKDGFAVLRDPIACKPAVMAENDDWVAMASEYRAIAVLPGADDAETWEPEPARVYSWERQPA